jgi:DNA mismatch endonuclease (patch repair protein)
VSVPSPWQSTEAGRHLSGRSSKNTLPEVSLGSALHRLGLRYRKHVRLAKGCTPDLVLARHRLAVFTDGCYWHQCPEHGRTEFNGPNAELWREKMARNKARDLRAIEIANGLGYTVVRVWECAVMRDPHTAALTVLAAIGGGT